MGNHCMRQTSTHKHYHLLVIVLTYYTLQKYPVKVNHCIYGYSSLRNFFLVFEGFLLSITQQNDNVPFPCTCECMTHKLYLWLTVG